MASDPQKIILGGVESFNLTYHEWPRVFTQFKLGTKKAAFERLEFALKIN